MFSFNLLPSLFNISTFTVFACLSSILDFQGSKYVDSDITSKIASPSLSLTSLSAGISIEQILFSLIFP